MFMTLYISSLNNVTVTLYGRNFYYHPVTKTNEVKSTDISNAAAFCSEIHKQIQRKRLTLQSLSKQTLKQNTAKLFATDLRTVMRVNSISLSSLGDQQNAMRVWSPFVNIQLKSHFGHFSASICSFPLTNL